MGIWVGYDDNKIIDNNQTRFLKYIWADVMENYNKNKKSKWYETPSDCIAIKLNPINGLLPSENSYSKYLYFKKNNIPTFLYSYIN